MSTSDSANDRDCAWRVATQDVGSDSIRSYTGKDYDASGLIYFNARYYDPTTGRFLTEDPSRQGVNWYAYVENNPVNWQDFTGRAGGPADAEPAGNQTTRGPQDNNDVYPPPRVPLDPGDDPHDLEANEGSWGVWGFIPADAAKFFAGIPSVPDDRLYPKEPTIEVDRTHPWRDVWNAISRLVERLLHPPAPQTPAPNTPYRPDSGGFSTTGGKGNPPQNPNDPSTYNPSGAPFA